MAKSGITSGNIIYDGYVRAQLQDTGGMVADLRAFGGVGDAVIDGSGVVTGTDNTTALQAAIDAMRAQGGGRIFIPAGLYAYSSPLTTGATDISKGLIFEGQGGLVWTFPFDQKRTLSGLVYTGSGSASAIVCTNSLGVAFKNLGLYYSSPTFTGILVNFAGFGGANTARSMVDRCHLSSLVVGGTWIRSAKALIGLSQVVVANILNSSLSGAQSLIRGIETTADYSNDVVIRDCVLDYCGVAQIMNPSLNWSVQNCTFEYPNTPTPIGITADTLSDQGVRLDVQGCSFWDPLITLPQVMIKQPVGHTWDFGFEGNWIHNFSQASALIQLLGPGSCNIDGNTFASVVPTNTPTLIDLGNSATALKQLARVVGNRWFANNSGAGYADAAIINVSGHKNLEIRNNSSDGSGREYITLTAQERLGYRLTLQNRPTPTPAAGQTLADYQVYGTDAAGIIKIINGASPSVAGALLDVTFSTPYLPFPLSSGIDANHRMLSVILTPVETPEGLGVDAVNAGVYVKVAYATQTGFTLCTKNAVAANTTVLYSYRVIQI